MADDRSDQAGRTHRAEMPRARLRHAPPERVGRWISLVHPEQRRPGRRHRALHGVERKHQVPRPRADNALHVRRAGIAAARLENIHSVHPGHEVAKRNRSQKIPDHRRNQDGIKHRLSGAPRKETSGLAGRPRS